jgi:hypothetical protein
VKKPKTDSFEICFPIVSCFRYFSLLIAVMISYDQYNQNGVSEKRNYRSDLSHDSFPFSHFIFYLSTIFVDLRMEIPREGTLG